MCVSRCPPNMLHLLPHPAAALLCNATPTAASHLAITHEHSTLVSLRQHNDPQLCAQALVDEALARNSSDNVTVICCCFGDEPPRRRVYGSGIGRSVSRDGLNSLAALLGQQL